MKRTLISLVFLFVISPVFGHWQLIDNFEQWEVGQIFTEAEDIGWHAVISEDTDEYWMLEDPYDYRNISMFANPGNYVGGSYYYLWVMKELPEGGIAPDETGTIYFRLLWDSLNNDFAIGTSDKSTEYDETTGIQTAPGAFDDFNALVQLGDDLEIVHSDGESFISTNPPMIIDMNTWYQFWMIIENTWDYSTTPPTSTGVYMLYIQGAGFGDGTSPTLVSVGAESSKDTALLRRTPIDKDGNPQSMIWIMFGTEPGMNWAWTDLFLLDDLYFFKGENLSNPLLAGWTDYPIDPAGDVDTGDWLGWLNVSQAPHIWSYAINGWIYMEEPEVDAAGAWVYFYK